MSHYVICPICQRKFDRDKVEYVKYGARRYAHPECVNNTEQQKSQEEIDKEELDKYIMNLFGTEYVDPQIQKQIKQYINDNKYTYSGIRKALIYFYEIKHGDLKKSNGRISIVPYVYNDAKRYYRAIWEAQQENRMKPPEAFQKPKDVIVKISIPKKPYRMGRFFHFLDKEEEDD